MKNLFFFILLSLNLTNPAKSELDTSRWMELLYSKYPEVRLRDIIIPGTHNSGTHNITKKSKIGPREKKYYKLAKKRVANWAKTQNHDISTQLKGGIRLIDLRVQRDKETFVIVHGLISVTLESILEDLAKWALKRPKEIVLVELIPGLSTRKDERDLHQLIQRFLGPLLVPPFLPPSQLTLQDIWAKKKSFLLFSTPSFSSLDNLYWNRNLSMVSLWANTTKKDDLLEKLLYGKEETPGLYNQDNSKFYTSELTFTPNKNTIVRAIFKRNSPKSLFQLMKPLYEAPNEFLRIWKTQSLNINIIKVDFYEKTNLVKSALNANQETLTFLQVNSPKPLKIDRL
ncbi:hypothetical protein OAK75_02340 [Bacteriovoracales bacterium]|nr:hypothetical protein [Bacteriovoracales bacterium]